MKNITLIHGESLPAKEGVDKSFRNDAVNDAYAHFSSLGSKYDVEIIIAAPESFENSLQYTGFIYSPEEKGWKKVTRTPVAVYDRFSFPGIEQDQKIRKNLNFEGIPIINHSGLELICKDKKLTSETFPEYAIPTVKITKGRSSKLEKELFDSLNNSDLSTENLVNKPIYGSGGEGISLLKPSESIYSKDDDLILQPYLETNKGIPELSIQRRHDLRVIVVNGTPITAEARIVNENKQGMEIFFPKSHNSTSKALPLDLIPEKYIEAVKAIDRKLEEYKTRIYSVDMAEGASGKVWLFELNSRPQQTWNALSPADLVESRKKQQESIVEALSRE